MVSYVAWFPRPSLLWPRGRVSRNQCLLIPHFILSVKSVLCIRRFLISKSVSQKMGQKAFIVLNYTCKSDTLKRWLRFAPRSSWCFLWKVEGLMKFRLRGNWARAEDRPHKSRSSGYHKWIIARGFWPTGICCLLNYFSSNNSILFSSIQEKNLLLKWTNLAAACSNKKLDIPVWKIERWTFFGTKSA